MIKSSKLETNDKGIFLKLPLNQFQLMVYMFFD